MTGVLGFPIFSRATDWNVSAKIRRACRFGSVGTLIRSRPSPLRIGPSPGRRWRPAPCTETSSCLCVFAPCTDGAVELLARRWAVGSRPYAVGDLLPSAPNACKPAGAVGSRPACHFFHHSTRSSAAARDESRTTFIARPDSSRSMILPIVSAEFSWKVMCEGVAVNQKEGQGRFETGPEDQKRWDIILTAVLLPYCRAGDVRPGGCFGPLGTAANRPETIAVDDRDRRRAAAPARPLFGPGPYKPWRRVIRQEFVGRGARAPAPLGSFFRPPVFVSCFVLTCSSKQAPPRVLSLVPRTRVRAARMRNFDCPAGTWHPSPPHDAPRRLPAHEARPAQAGASPATPRALRRQPRCRRPGRDPPCRAFLSPSGPKG